MALLNLLLAAILTALGLFDGNGSDGGDSQGEGDASAQGAGSGDGGDAGDDNDGSQGDAGTDSDSGSSSDDPQERRLTRENQSLRRRLRELEQKEQDRTRAEMSELDRLKAEIADRNRELDELRGERKAARTSSAIEKAAKAAGFSRPDVAARLIDVSALEIDDDGAPDEKALADAIAKLKADVPQLLAGTSSSPANGGAGNDRRKGSMTAEDAAKLARENPAEFNRLFDAKDAALMAALAGK